MDITKFNVTTTAQAVVSATRRRAIIIQNHSDTDIYIAFDNSGVTGPAGSYPGIKIPASGGIFAATSVSPWDQTCDRVLHAIHAGSGNKVLVVHEDKS